jgi:aspartyl-tRNA(Asn)/glutamyl-tRNA(Gln) amidotransferase subunit A
VSDELAGLTIAELAPRLRDRELSPVEVAEASVRRMEATEPDLNAFITRTGDQALAAARAAEAEILAGNYRGPLHGIPFVTKDLFWTKGVRTTSGSQADLGFVPGDDAGVVQRLQDAGAYSVGKSNMSEWAFSIIGENEFFGWPHNPWALGRVPGGSSSGSAAAVAAGVAPLSLGSDTGGSIRVPAALCGLTGLKPTYGLVSRYGATPLSWSNDHAGPLARTARDVAIAMNALAGHDPRDPYSANRPSTDHAAGLESGIAGLRVGVPREFVWDVIDPEVEALVRAAIARLAGLGAIITDVSLPELGMIPAGITPVEAAAYHDDRIRRDGHLYNQRIRKAIEAGLFIPAATYVQAQRVRAMIGRKLAAAFRSVDVIATAAVPVGAPAIDVDTLTVSGQTLPTRRVLTRLTSPFNLNGHPALSAPCGFTADGLPVGLQFVGRPFEDATVLRAAHAYQGVTDWHMQRPGLDRRELNAA